MFLAKVFEKSILVINEEITSQIPTKTDPHSSKEVDKGTTNTQKSEEFLILKKLNVGEKSKTKAEEKLIQF